MTHRQISVIIPAHNAAKFIGEALDSTIEASTSVCEIVVVDDASDDDTANIVSAWNRSGRTIQYHYLPDNVGPGPARNVGLSFASGDFVAFLDADDIYVPGALDTLIARFREAPSTDVVMGRIQALRQTAPGDAFVPDGPHVRCFQLGSSLIRRSVVDTVGAFDEAFRHGEDIDWYFRAQEANASFSLLDDVVLHHRRHDHNMSRNTSAAAMDLALIMRRSLQRRQRLAEARGVSVEDIYYVRPDTMTGQMEW